MNIHNIIYQKTFNLGQFQSERIGVEISINEGEDAKEALRTAKNLVEEYHQESSPDEFRGTQERIIETKDKLTPLEETKREISTCKEVKVLESYRLIVKNNPELKETYDNQLQILEHGN